MAIILRRRKLGLTSCRAIAEKASNNFVVIRNDHPIPDGHNLVVRWGCTSNVPVRNVLNTSAAIHQVNDKIGFRQLMNDQEIGDLRTYFNRDDVLHNNVFPCIVRPRRHSQGRRLYVCNTREDFLLAVSHVNDFYASPLINKTEEYRVFVVSGRAVCVARKYPANEEAIAWNVAQGGRFENVRWNDWNLKAVRVALEAFNATELDFGGVDIMVDANNNCYVLEINSAPSLTSEYRQECFAKAFDYVVEHGKQRIPLITQRGGYKKFIHPAINPEALI